MLTVLVLNCVMWAASEGEVERIVDCVSAELCYSIKTCSNPLDPIFSYTNPLYTTHIPLLYDALYIMFSSTVVIFTSSIQTEMLCEFV